MENKNSQLFENLYLNNDSFYPHHQFSGHSIVGQKFHAFESRMVGHKKQKGNKKNQVTKFSFF